MVQKTDKTHCDVKMHSTVTVGAKGQVVIPQEVREILNIQPGDSLMVVTKCGKAIGMIKTDDMAELINYMNNEIHNSHL